MKMPVRLMPTLEFKYKNNRSVSNTATLLAVLGSLPKYFGYIRQLDAVVRETQPDIIPVSYTHLTLPTNREV